MKARGSSAGSARSTPFPRRSSWRAGSRRTIIDPVDGPAVRRTTRSRQARFSRLAQLALRNGWYPAPNISAAAGQLSGDPYAATGRQPVHRARSIRISPRLGRVFGRYTKSTVRQPRPIRICWRSATASSSRTRPTGRCPTPGRSAATSSTSSGWAMSTRGRTRKASRARRQMSTSFGLTGTFTGLPDAQRECPAIGIQGFAGTGGAVQRLQRQQPADVGREQHDDVDDWRPHAQFRRELSALVAAARPRDGFLGSPTTSTSASPVTPWRTCCSGTTPTSASSSRRIQRAGAPGNPREFNFKYFAPYFQDDWRVTSRLTVNLGLRWDYRNVPVRDEEPDGLAEPRLRARRFAGCGSSRSSTAASWMARTTRGGTTKPREPGSSSRSSLPGSALPGGLFDDAKTVVRGGYGVFFDSAEGREIDGAADVYPYVSRSNYIQIGWAGHAASDLGLAVSQLRRARAWRRQPRTRSSRSASRPSRETRTCSSGRSACSAS